MSWYAVDGATFMVGAITQQELWRIGAPSWWNWDRRGFVDDEISRRLVWDPNIEGSIHGGLTQEQSVTQWFVWDLGINV